MGNCIALHQYKNIRVVIFTAVNLLSFTYRFAWTYVCGFLGSKVTFGTILAKNVKPFHFYTVLDWESAFWSEGGNSKVILK